MFDLIYKDIYMCVYIQLYTTLDSFCNHVYVSLYIYIQKNIYIHLRMLMFDIYIGHMCHPYYDNNT